MASQERSGPDGKSCVEAVVAAGLRLDVKSITTMAQNLLWLTPTGLYLYLFISDVATYQLNWRQAVRWSCMVTDTQVSGHHALLS
jgi:hypothetical protein